MDNVKGARLRRDLPSGMTLAEVLMAVVVLAIGLVAIMALQTNTMQASALASRVNTASFLAESKLEELQALVLDFDSVANVSQDPEHLSMDGESCEAETEGCIFTRTASIVSRFPTSLSYEISVRVEWPGAGVASTTFDTVISAVGF
jgi:prepilin-type N-terminal cleavage/methylation domain